MRDPAPLADEMSGTKLKTFPACMLPKVVLCNRVISAYELKWAEMITRHEYDKECVVADLKSRYET